MAVVNVREDVWVVGLLNADHRREPKEGPTSKCYVPCGVDSDAFRNAMSTESCSRASSIALGGEEKKKHEKFSFCWKKDQINTCLLDVSIRLRLDVVQTQDQFLIVRFDALESLRWQGVIRGPCGNQTIYAAHGLVSGRVDREIG